MFWILICMSSWWYHLQYLHRYPKNKGQFVQKGNSVSSMLKWLIYCAMALWIVWQKNNLVFVTFAIHFIPRTVVRCPSHGKFVHGLANILFMAYHTSHCINAIVCTCQVFGEWRKFHFLSLACFNISMFHNNETWGTMDLLCFPQQPQSTQCLQGRDTPSNSFRGLFIARSLWFVNFCPIVSVVLQVTIAFEFSFFSLAVKIHRWGKYVAQTCGSPCSILGEHFPPNLMPLLSCHLSCPKESLSSSLFFWVGVSWWCNVLSFG